MSEAARHHAPAHCAPTIGRPGTRRRSILLAGCIAALLLVAAACERNEDGSYSVDQAYLCVRLENGAIRWTPDKVCGNGELLMRVDEPETPAPAPVVDPGPQPTSWSGQVAMGATSAAVSADGATRTVVQSTTEKVSAVDPAARCELVFTGATTHVFGKVRTVGIGDVANATVEWADPTADNSVSVSCTGDNGFTQPVAVILALIPVG